MAAEELAGIVAELIGDLGRGVPTALPQLETAPNGKGYVTLVRDGYSLQTLSNRQRNRRTHMFRDMRSLTAWLHHQVSQFGADPKCIEVIMSDKCIEAALDPRDVDADVVSAPLEHHPCAKLWMDAFAKKMSQQELHGFLRGVSPTVIGPGDFDGKVLLGEIAKLTVQTQLDRRGFYSFATDGGSTSVAGRIPPEITVRTPIFADVLDVDGGGECSYVLGVTVSMDIDDTGRVAFTLDCPGLPLILHQAHSDAAACLRQLLGAEFQVYLGAPRVTAVAVAS